MNKNEKIVSKAGFAAITLQFGMVWLRAYEL